ncbi:MAG TPA: CdaR family protein [Thermoanaerobaculia bacterium]|nr:CdaR family protein [Thermoanaerobaculia bacterium]
MIRRFGPHLLALFVAFVIWVIASESRREEVLDRTLTVPVAVLGVPPNMVLSGNPDETVKITVRGPESRVRSLAPETLGATIDLSGARPGALNVPIPAAAIDTPRNVEVISIQPPTLRVQLELLQRKYVSIRPYLVGSPAEGYEVENIEPHPDNALIIGPASLVEEVSEIPTERVILTGRTGTFRETVGVLSDYPLVRVVQPATAEVIVTIASVNPAQQAPEGDGAP